jgi:hypothetical protein
MERLAYRPLQLSVEAYERSAREGGAQGLGLATFLIKHTRGSRRLRTRGSSWLWPSPRACRGEGTEKS